MELFKQFTEMLENFINGVVDRRLAETPKQPPVNPEALKVIVDDYLRRTGYIPELVKQAIQDNIAAGINLEQQLLELLNQDGEPDRITPVERAVRQIAKDSIPADLVTESFVEEYCGEFLDEDQVENSVMGTLRNNHRDMTDIIHDNLDSNRLRETIRHNDIVEDIFFDHIVDSARFNNSVKDHFSDNGVFEDRVCEIIRNKL